MAFQQHLVLMLLIAAACSSLAQGASFHSYASTCPTAEKVIKNAVEAATAKDPTIPAGLLRLHFHDCFVEGCDGSILLESTPTNGRDVERFAQGNNNSVRGFEVIEAAKTKLEAACPGVVSCADILAIAARDSSLIYGGLSYEVPTGRFDGRVSSRTAADARLPSPFFTYAQLKSNFAEKGLSIPHDLVVLSGGHTIGRSKCRFFDSRIYNFNGTGQPDPTLDATYREQLRKECPQGANPSPAVALDKNSEFSFDNVYYRNLEGKSGLLTSDQTLLTDPDARNLVNSLAQNPPQFRSMFAQSMINMGNIGWKTSANGEIRKRCSAVNTRITTEAGDVAAF